MDYVIPLSKKIESRRMGIFWSYDNRGASEWVSACMKTIEDHGFVWWDVGWRIKFDQFTFPLLGYIWTTQEQQVKYGTTIESESRMLKQPDKTFAREVHKNWEKQGLPFGRNDRLDQYLRDKRKQVTLLKLSEIEELNPPKRLNDFTLWNGNPLSKPTRNYKRILIS